MDQFELVSTCVASGVQVVSRGVPIAIAFYVMPEMIKDREICAIDFYPEIEGTCVKISVRDEGNNDSEYHATIRGNTKGVAEMIRQRLSSEDDDENVKCAFALLHELQERDIDKKPVEAGRQ